MFLKFFSKIFCFNENYRNFALLKGKISLSVVLKFRIHVIDYAAAERKN